MIKKCPVCLKAFEARRDKVCCSEKCSRRRRRTPSKGQQLRQYFDDAHSSVRFISAYTDDPAQKARALNMLRAIVRSAATELPDYLRISLGKEILESVDSRAYRSYVGQQNVRHKTRFNEEGGISDDE